MSKNKYYISVYYMVIDPIYIPGEMTVSISNLENGYSLYILTFIKV